MATPEEDEISKQQLWERIEAGRAATESHVQALYTRIEDLKEVVNKSVQVLVQENLKMQSSSKAIFMDNIAALKKEVEKIINNALTTFTRDTREQTDRLDKKLIGVKEALMFQISKEIDNRMNFLSSTAKLMMDTANEERAFHTAQMNKFQVETRDKMAVLEKKFDSTLAKFKEIADNLSGNR